ncbi:MAG: FAD:protein FMN transferase [Acidimicrobiales bacterium]
MTAGAAPAHAPSPPRRAWVEQIMGMPVSVHLRGPAALGDTAAGLVAAVFDHLRHVDAVFSTYRPESDVTRLNRGDVRLDACHPWVGEVVTLCAEATARTGGWFDARLPAPGGGTWFDPSGLVKGWSVEAASRWLADVDDADFCLNAGGDVVVGIATADAGPWRVGIEDPGDVSRVLAVVEAWAGGVATSGRARRGLHIVDPRSGAPATGLQSATVVGPSLMWADVYATAMVAGGRESVDWLGGLDGYEAMVVTDTSEVLATAGWRQGQPEALPAVVPGGHRQDRI